VPLALTANAAAGYSGFGKLVALPLTTPAEIDFGFGVCAETFDKPKLKAKIKMKKNLFRILCCSFER
jgi:hypothetical protein